MKKTVLEYLEESARRYPNKVAVIDERKQYTYEELECLSQKIGSAIAKRTSMRQPIAVLLEKGADALCTFMGIAQAGCFYVLLNPDLPKHRLQTIVSILQPRYIITDDLHRLQAEELISLEGVWVVEQLLNETIDSDKLKEVRSKVIDTDPLYAHFTSGSTGTPKGVVVSQRSVIDFIDVFAPMFSIEERDVIGNQAPFDFDVSVKDMYTALKVGATLVVIPKALFSQPAKLLDFICDHEVTTMIWAVSAICLISSFHGLEYRVPSSVRRILFSGEVMPYNHLKSWMSHLPHAEFINLYGPTEITCNCTYHRIDPNRDYSNGIPIGTAFPNEHVFLLNEDQQEIHAPEEIGEICVRGTALALGYFGDPVQTQQAFVDNPLNPFYAERIYRTGDLGKYNEFGELVFCGRKDFQIKYMGHRIEIEEIERTIASISGVERCCVLFRKEKQRLDGFYTGTIDRSELYETLRKQLPIYMIPRTLKKIEQFSLTKNGKIDRSQL